jgi:hypothetical protein
MRWESPGDSIFPFVLAYFVIPIALRHSLRWSRARFLSKGVRGKGAGSGGVHVVLREVTSREGARRR